MKREVVVSLTGSFESHAQETESGVEFWLTRDLQHLLGYAEWRNFGTVISRAKTACEVSGFAIPDHFVDVNKMVDLGSGSKREIDDIKLTRYASTSFHRSAVERMCQALRATGRPRKSLPTVVAIRCLATIPSNWIPALTRQYHALASGFGQARWGPLGRASVMEQGLAFPAGIAGQPRCQWGGCLD